MPTVNKLHKTYINTEILPRQVGMEAGAQAYFWDASCPGLALKLTPAKAVFIVQQRMKTEKGKEKNTRVVIGRYPTMTVEEAREEAAKVVAVMRGGVDPVKRKKAKTPDGVTLQRCLDDYLSKYDLKLRPKTKDVYSSAVRRCFKDWLDMELTDIDSEMIAARQLEISNANGPRGKGEAQANQAMRVLRRLYNYAGFTYKDANGKRLITSNPVLCLKEQSLWNANKKRHDIIHGDVLSDWYQAVVKVESETIRDYILLCLFTGLRRGEAARLKWSNVKLTGKKPILVIPAEDTKTNSEHQLPLTGFVFELLQRRSKVRNIDNDYVFPGAKRGAHIVEPKRAIASIIEKSGVDFSMHTLRRTFSTVAERLDISYYKHKKLMNHSVGNDITGDYTQVFTEDLREPMQKISQYFCERLGMVEADKTDVQA